VIRGITADTISLSSMSISNGMFNTGVLYQDALLDANRVIPPQYNGNYGSVGNMILPVQATNHTNNIIGPKKGVTTTTTTTNNNNNNNGSAKTRRDYNNNNNYDPANGAVYTGYE